MVSKSFNCDEIDNEATVNLTSETIVFKNSYEKQNQPKKWTIYLICCCLTVTMSSFQFGYNISSWNKPSALIKEFIKSNTFLFKEYHEKYELFHESEEWLIGNETKFENGILDIESKKSEYLFCGFSFDTACTDRIEEEKQKKEAEYQKKYNMSIDQFLICASAKLKSSRKLLEEKRILLNAGTEKVNRITEHLWTFLNCLFVLGGIYGAFKSKGTLDYFGRKNGLLFHYGFTILGSISVFVSPVIKSPLVLGLSRLLFGIQGAMSCSLVPIYLNEISPACLRGQIGVAPQIFITFGILIGQLFGFDQILGSSGLWNYLLALPIIPALIGSLLLLVFFPETPKALYINNEFCAAEEALKRLRDSFDVSVELQEMKKEFEVQMQTCNKWECQQKLNNDQTISMLNLIRAKEYRWQLITAATLQITQQLSGINAIFFYSADIFKFAGIPDDYIQYAILLTGIVNLMATFACIPLIDRLGRKPLLIVPMIIIAVNYILLTVFLTLKVCISFKKKTFKKKLLTLNFF
jgi:MFS family permease